MTSGTYCRMSGILKRKLEEEPSSYLSLQGSEDDEVSCSDSGNSSDSVNNSVPSGILDCKISPKNFFCLNNLIRNVFEKKFQMTLCSCRIV